jgi:hypothetical protein
MKLNYHRIAAMGLLLLYYFLIKRPPKEVILQKIDTSENYQHSLQGAYEIWRILGKTGF